MKRNVIFGAIAMMMLAVMPAGAQSKVYMTKEISPEALVKIYKALGRPADGHRVAVKISTGEAGNAHKRARRQCARHNRGMQHSLRR